MSRCYNGGKKHKFIPRYSEVPIGDCEFKGVISHAVLKRLIVTKIYICDICEWCGEKIKKED